MLLVVAVRANQSMTRYIVKQLSTVCIETATTTPSTTSTTRTTTSTTRTTTTTTATTTTRGPFTCPKPDGFFPIPGTCGSEYYICVGGSSTLTVSLFTIGLKYHFKTLRFLMQNCPPGNVFDPETLVCLAPEDSSCCNEADWVLGFRQQFFKYLFVVDQPFSCPASEGFFAIPNTCGSDFYVCVSGAVYVDVTNNWQN